ncbi:helix-turn-helix domain-containing protein [Cupriavidus sp. 8B]
MSLREVRPITHEAAREQVPHAHAEGQLFSVKSGVVSIEAGGGRWLMPTGCTGWVPPYASHGARIHGSMTGMSLYFDEAWSRAAMPATLKVVRLSPLLVALLDTLAQGEPPAGPIREHYLAVLADAFTRQPAQTLFLPMPQEPRLLRMATALLASPDDNTDLDGWAARIGMARRTLTRHFQADTGWSLAQWRQQLRMLAAMERLVAGESVTTVALGLGYASVSSFIALFRRYTGTTPRAYLAMGKD